MPHRAIKAHVVEPLPILWLRKVKVPLHMLSKAPFHLKEPARLITEPAIFCKWTIFTYPKVPLI